MLSNSPLRIVEGWLRGRMVQVNETDPATVTRAWRAKLVRLAISEPLSIPNS